MSDNTTIREVSCLFGTVKVTGIPVTVEEFDTAAGRQGAALDSAIRQVLYHKTLGEAREDIVAAAVKAFDFERLEIDTGKKTKKDEKPILVDEDAAAYVKRLFADRGWDTDEPPKEWTDFVASVEVKLDPSAKVRESKPKELPKIYVKSVDQIWAKGSQAKAASVLGIALTGDEKVDREALGWAIKAREDAKRREAESKMVSDLT